MSKKLEISMPRGDLRPVAFRVVGVDGGATPEITEIYATFKRSFRHTEYLFQKRLSTGDIEQIGEGSYQFSILPQDTDSLPVDSYVFDIEVVGPDLKQTFVGDFVLTNEATYAANEEGVDGA